MAEDLGTEERRLDIGGLRVRVAPNARAACARVAAEIAGLVRGRRAAGLGTVLGLATGRSTLGVYGELARLVREEGLDLFALRAFALDEYLGLGPEQPTSFAAYVRRHVIEPLGLDAARVQLLPGEVPPARATEVCQAYERALVAAGGIDLQLLGIGLNGHLAFNEPGSPRDSRTRLVVLDEDTRSANARDFPPDVPVPGRALSIGIATILEARRLRVLALGAHKADIVRRTLLEPIGPALPATFLREHGDVELHLDPQAACGLPA